MERTTDSQSKKGAGNGSRQPESQLARNQGKKEKSLWLKLFCPKDQCFFDSPTDAP